MMFTLSAGNNCIMFSIDKRQRMPKGQSEMDNPEKQKKPKPSHNMCWTALCAVRDSCSFC